MLSDADLLRAAQGGDATSLGILLGRYRAALYGQALGVLGYENPRDEPFHCPPATTQVHFQRDGLTHRVHLYFAPRPREEGGRENDARPRSTRKPYSGASSSVGHKGAEQMRAKSEEIPVVFEEGGVVSRQVQWGEMQVARETAPAGMDTRPSFKGLPEDSCRCPHWGYMIKGRARVIYADREETLEPGDAYYLEPGHNLVVGEGGEVVEFSPAGEYGRTMQAVAEKHASRPLRPVRASDLLPNEELV